MREPKDIAFKSRVEDEAKALNGGLRKPPKKKALNSDHVVSVKGELIIRSTLPT